MKLSLSFFAALLALCKADKVDSDSDSRRLRGRGKLSPGRIENMLDTKCPDFDCDATTVECTFERPERPDTSGMDEDEKAEMWTEFKAKKEERRQKMLECVCCSGMSVEDILALKAEAGGSRPSGMGGSGGGGGGRPGGRPGGMGGGGGFKGRGGGFGRQGIDGEDGAQGESSVSGDGVSSSSGEDMP